MDPPTLKPNQLRNILVRLLTFGVLVLAVRFAYVITLAGESCGYNDFCFFPDHLRLRGSASLDQNAAVSGSKDPLGVDLWSTKKWRRTVDYYSAIFQELIAEGFLAPNSKALCVGTRAGEDVLALKENGVVNSIGISGTASPPLILPGAPHRQPFDEASFDFEFSANGSLDRSGRPADFANEVCRTLKPGGFFVAQIFAKDNYSFNSFLDLFNCCRLIRTRDVDGVDTTSVREVVLRKEAQFLNPSKLGLGGNSSKRCLIPGYKRELIRKAEPLIEQEPLKPWIAWKRNLKKVKYLTSMADISFKQRYVYIDVGARSYGSSIGSWFKKQYPKQSKSFEVYAIEADRVFHEEYRDKEGVSLVPYAAWVRNETLFFEITRDSGSKDVEMSRGIGRRINHNVRSSSSYGEEVDKIKGIDFVEWLKRSVSESDFVVAKMDVEGSEFYLVPRLIESGAICLIDEVFMECHYNRWQRCCRGQRSAKFKRSYGQCLELFTKLREAGVLVHQW
ncbi:putative S-adenosyl-L-methionine-dependent methyltransferase [Rosa chinensis]|uniref:Putative S-adenosyl-L-methionine-dependent methyltransferase n=2 Tax=Rosa chinensis TaxID=74649 RepID=A0A2P6QKI7_ROSCH|nr:uncharacterized protein LOC112167293 isoform X1 [Rosa chinensis]PRQ34682.1 putative S-adenosyl-L-methionine-dependent methyltransferase [Rosa chinensis]